MGRNGGMSYASEEKVPEYPGIMSRIRPASCGFGMPCLCDTVFQ